MNITLTARQKNALQRQLVDAEHEIARELARAAQAIAAAALRDSKLAAVRSMLLELGKAPPDTIVSVKRKLDANGDWTGNDITVT